MKIKKIKAREILDSRGNPTVETVVILDNGLIGMAAVPSGASTGKHEALELRDGGKRYNGLGVLKAVNNVNVKINKLLVGQEVSQQQQLDQAMIKLDGTANKSQLGANAILSVSLACAQAAALANHEPLYKYIRRSYGFKLKGYHLPQPMFNVFNGGKHADTNLDFQEFMILPLKPASFKEKVRVGSEIFHQLGKVLIKKGLDTDLGNEGGYAPNIGQSRWAIKLILEAIKEAGYKAGQDVALGLDVAASELYDTKKKKYYLKTDRKKLDGLGLIRLYEKWLRDYPIISIEDGLAEDDWLNWQVLTKILGQKIRLVGDDLFVTNVKRFKEGIDRDVANTILIKLNQIGTLSETIDCIKLAQKNKYDIIISHRSGETTDTAIADLAVAVNAEYIKAGSLARGERVAKYNRLMALEEELKK
ncbi:MAG: phosphopyruvate hydratase [bacterium]